MTDRLKVGVVGAGVIAQVMHLNYLRELSDCFEIVALCDISGENAANNAERKCSKTPTSTPSSF
jgi:predicted dehydrogenase